MIVQNENGRLRLSEEFFALPFADLDPWLRVSPPPPYGLTFTDAHFRGQLAEEISNFKPDAILIDPWNAVAQDDKAKDYIETFNLIRSVVPAGDNGPAIGIVAHTRKPKHDERASRRGLMNLLAGSYVLASVSRAVFVLQPASVETEDNRVVFTCCENIDGPMGPQTAWIRRNGLFEPVPDFDWDAFRKPGANRVAISEEDMAAVFECGKRTLKRTAAHNALIEQSGCEKSAAYHALSANSRFRRRLSFRDGKVIWS
jgi:hypothetical protein